MRPPLPLPPLLVAAAIAAAAPPSVALAQELVQNMCGSDWADAVSCGAACPKGTDEECPSGKMCYAEVPGCPAPVPKPTISPKPTRMPVPTFPLGRHDKQILGYYASWQWYDRGKLAKPSALDYKKITRVNFAFFQTDEEGNIWGTDEWADPRVLFGDVDASKGECSAGQPKCRCSWVEPQYKSCMYHKEQTGLIWLTHQARGDIYPSIGGWTLSDAFPPMAADATSRKIFARNCRDLILDYGFDGIDLDWEYPGYAAHSGTPADKQNFNLLLRDVREELDRLQARTGRFYGLTAALPCGPSNINNIDILEVSKYLTEFNLMSYDFHGAWDKYTGVNSPLYDQSSDPEPGWSVDGCVRNWVERGAPRERLNIGLGFYGRSFRNANRLGVEHGGTDDAAWEVDEGTPQYFNIMEQIKDMTIKWDSETGTPYAYFNDHKGGLVSYDDEQSICLKTDYAIKNGLNGFIIWELSGDVMEDLHTPLLDSMNRKLSYPLTNCADPYGPWLPPTTTSATTTRATTTTTFTTTTTSTTTSATTTTTEPEATTTETALETTTTEPTTTTTTTELTDTTSEDVAEGATKPNAAATSATILAAATTQAAVQLSSVSEAMALYGNSADVAGAALESYAQVAFADGRKPVRRDNTKPNKPYRPPKEMKWEL